MEKAHIFWLCILCLAAGVAGDHYLPGYFKGEPPKTADNAAAAGSNENPAVGSDLKTYNVEDTCPLPWGDVYIADDKTRLWIVRNAEAMPVRIVDHFSSGPAKPTTREYSDAMRQYELRTTRGQIEDQIIDASKDASNDTGNDADNDD